MLVLFTRNIANFYSLAPSALAESLEIVGWGSARKINPSLETLLAHFEYMICIEVKLVRTRELQNIDIHLQRKNTTVDTMLLSTSMACCFCLHVKIRSVPEDIYMRN